jgi:hypothetical protein
MKKRVKRYGRKERKMYRDDRHERLSARQQSYEGGVSPTILAENDKLRVLRKLKRNAIKSESLTKADLKRSTGCIEDSVVQPLPQGIIRML